MTPTVRYYTEQFRRERPDRSILDCYQSARSFVHFMATIKRNVKEHEKRSRAAKKAWKKRKAAAAQARLAAAAQFLGDRFK